MKRPALAALFLVLLTLAPVSAEVAKITVPLRFDRYYMLAEVNEAIKAIHEAYPEMTTVEEVGRSEEGRPIMAVTLNNPKTGPALSKPGVYVDGNIHGNEIQGGEICLYLLDYLLGNYGKNKEVAALVDKNCFYIVPVVNVDGRYHFMADPNNSSSNRSLRIPIDDDRDGLVDEDGPDDLDGDGSITQMRRKDPFGRYKTSPEDPRLMIPIKPGEKGEWTILGEEGIDNDGDGEINEDGEGYVDPNRQWSYDWAPSYVESGSGEYPFQAVGLKALALWTMAKTNICVGWSFHNSGGMYLRGPARQGLGEYPAQDIAVYDYLGKQAERITPGYRYMLSWRDLYTTYGDSVEWIVRYLGAYAYCGEVFQSETETFKSLEEKKAAPALGGEEGGMRWDPSSIVERIKYNDNLTQGSLYKTWAPFKHPVYGDIEIGGWVKMSSRLSAPFMLPDLVHRNAMAVLFSAKNTPEVTLDVFEVKKVGENLYRVRTRLTNSKAIPSMSGLAQRDRLYPQDQLTVSGTKARVLAGGPLVDRDLDRVSYKKYKPELQFLTVPAFGFVEHQFLIEGRGEITIRYASRHAGTMEKKINF
ncbi:MAG: M14 family metallopeptidase [Candidatus Aminicenantales bacterium]